MTSILSFLGGGAALPYASDKKFRGQANRMLFGEENKIDKLSNYDPRQQQIHDLMGQLLQGGGGYENALEYLQGLLDPESDVYQNFEAPYMRQFNEQTLPNIAERYAGKGALSSSAFGQSLGAAGAGLQENLAAMKEGMRYKAAGDIRGEYGNYLQRQPFMYSQQPGYQGMAQQGISAAIQAYLGGG